MNQLPLIAVVGATAFREAASFVPWKPGGDSRSAP